MDSCGKIGILGGTFNPVHWGHIRLAEAALEQFSMEYVLLMPSPCPPHKQAKDLASPEDRGEMVRLAVEGHQNLFFSNFEFQRSGPIYSADTLALLKKEHPEQELFFIIGSDALFSLETWRQPERIFSLCHLIAAGRNRQNDSTVSKQIDYLSEKYGANIDQLPFPDIPVSSTMIRNMVVTGTDITPYVPGKVAEYIREKGLYTYGGEHYDFR